MAKDFLFEAPRVMPKIEDCLFYHTIDLPGQGTMNGFWDLRQNADEYLGHVDLQGKRMLDVGTATGFMAFEAERRGAEVIAYDMGKDESYDCVPYYEELSRKVFGGTRQFVIEQHMKDRMRMHNAFWYSWHALGSRVKVRYGSAYDIPFGIGPVDVTLLGAILLHIRNPLTVLESAARLTGEAMIVTEPMFHDTDYDAPIMMFVPNVNELVPVDTYWQHTPRLIANFLQVLGFTKTNVTYHHQTYQAQNNKRVKFFTVVGRRPGGSSPANSDSSTCAGLRHSIRAKKQNVVARVDEPVTLELSVSNVGTAKWLHRTGNDVGAVKVGMHLYDSDRRVIDYDFLRSNIEADVFPGEGITTIVSFSIPKKGNYYIGVDLVSEHVCWFANYESEETLIKVSIE